MPEMPDAREDHREAGIVSRLDHIRIPHRATRLDDGGRTGIRSGEQPIREGEESV